MDKKQLLKTKLHPPAVFKEQVIRSSIIQQLEDGLQKPMSLVSAPAGYGKSQTVSQWLQETKAASGWVSLTQDDNDLRTFLEYFVAALQMALPKSLEHIQTLMSAGKLPPVKAIAHAFINELDEVEENVILVLDDYHLIKDKTIHQFLDELLVYPPQCLHLCLVTRLDPPLNLNRLLAQSRMVEVRMKHLSFSEEEIAQLYKNLLNETIGDDEASELKSRTEGWIVALRMASFLTFNAGEANLLFKDFTGNIYSLSKYLLEEILEKQPSEFQDVLLKVSTLDRFCVDLIANLPGFSKDRAQYFIDWLLQVNLFVIPLDQKNNWFRFHHLIQEFLQSICASRYSENEMAEIHISASQWFEENGFVVEAINHMMLAKHETEAAKIIIRNRLEELHKDNWYVVQQWLKKLPESSLKNANLLLAACWPAYENIQFEQLFNLLGQAENLLDKNQDPALIGEWNLLSGLFEFWVGNTAKAMSHFEQAKATLPPKENLFTGMLNLHISMARTVSGNMNLAIADLEEQINQSHGDAVYDTRLYSGLYYSNMFAGNLAQAKLYGNRVKTRAQDSGLDYTHAMGVCQEAMSCFCACQLKEAIALFEIAERNKFILHKGTAIDALAAKVISHELLGQPTAADKTLQILKEFTNDLNQDVYRLLSTSAEMRLGAMRNELRKPMEWQSTLDQPVIFAGLFIWTEVPILTQARVLIKESSEQSLEKASNLLSTVEAIASQYHLVNHQIEVAVLNTVIHLKRGDDEAKRLLESTIELAEPGKWVRPFMEWKAELRGLLEQVSAEHAKSYFYRLLLDSINDSTNKQQEEQPSTNNQTKEEAAEAEQLSGREIDIVKLMNQGFRNQEIADTLFISEGTVKKHIYNVGQKWSLHNRISIVHRAKELHYL